MSTEKEDWGPRLRRENIEKDWIKIAEKFASQLRGSNSTMMRIIGGLLLESFSGVLGLVLEGDHVCCHPSLLV